MGRKALAALPYMYEMLLIKSRHRWTQILLFEGREQGSGPPDVVDMRSFTFPVLPAELNSHF